MPDKLIDLCSNTATHPTPDMRRFMAEAPVGDEQKGEDPTVNLLLDKVCALLGKEAALFLPSSTMSNEIAFKGHFSVAIPRKRQPWDRTEDSD